MFHLHHSNRMERLADALAALLAEPLPDPLQPEIVVVQHPGLARWLEIELAERLGICANVRFPLPARFVWELVRSQPGAEVPEHDPLDREALALRIFRTLPGLLERPGFSGLRAYLAASDSPEGAPIDGALRRWRLAARIADVLDRYQVYRPELIRAWERGEAPDDWQAVLWRALRAEAGPGRVALIDRFLAGWAEGRRPVLPPRISVFGLSSLPPLYLEILRRTAEATELHLFFHNPSREWWADLVPERVRARIARRDPDRAAYYAVGNRLLAALGGQGRDFLALLYEGDGPDREHEHHEEPAAGPDAPLLHRIQSDLLALREGPEDEAARGVDPEDLSLRVHVCHSPLRECQVLHDQLLELFEHLPGLEPRDVVVMAPDMDRYAPFVEAVFGVQRRIPYAISDRAAVRHPLLRWFTGLLDLASGRMRLSEVLSLLEAPAALRRLDLTPEDVEPAARWLRRHGVRWGEDAADRAAAGLPPDHRHTWAFGRERLLLGYALPEPEGAGGLFEGIAPGEGVEGEHADRMGRVWDFVERLAAWRRRLREARPVAEWEALLDTALEAFLAPGGEDEEAALAGLRAAMAAATEAAARAGMDLPVGLAVYRALLEPRLAEPTAGVRFLGGGVTFCRLAPMRSIPFRVVCLLGMQDADYPRRAARPDFDRMREAPRRGDRSVRDDDRYLFLEAMLSARDAFHVSYVGRDLRDDSPRAPSVVLSELLDYVDRHYRLPDGAPPSARLTRTHPLHPFSRRCFAPGSPDTLWSYDAFWAGVAAAGVEAPAAAPGRGDDAAPALAVAPPAPGEAADGARRALALQRLARFLAHPVRGFLEERLGVRMELAPGLEIEDEEPLTLGPLEAYAVRERLLELLLEGRGPGEALGIVEAEGRLPPGALARLAAREPLAELGRLLPRLEPWRGPAAPPLAVELAVEARTRGRSEAEASRGERRRPPSSGARHPGTALVAGTLPDREDEAAAPEGAGRPWILAGTLTGRVAGRGLLRSRPGALRARDVLALWVEHLALCAAHPDQAGESVFVARDRVCRFPPRGPQEALARLGELIALFEAGRTRALPLPVETLWQAYLAAEGRPPDDAARALAVRRFLDPGEHGGRPGEAHDPSIRRVFGPAAPILLQEEETWSLAERLFRPLLTDIALSEGP